MNYFEFRGEMGLCAWNIFFPYVQAHAFAHLTSDRNN